MKNLLVITILLLIVSCKKQASTNLRPPKDVVLENKQKDQEVATRKNPCPSNNPHCPGNPPPPPPVIQGKKGCLLLDFDGYNNTSTLWNVSNVASSGLDQTQINDVLTRAKSYYSFEDSLTITTDENTFNSFPKYKRRRIVITTTNFYGNVGGVAYINSFSWDDDTPCFVFSSLLGFNTKYISDASSHEGGHTFGCRHDADWSDDCVFRSNYLVGDYLMGNSYASPNPYFATAAANDICCTCIENSKLLIHNTLIQ